MLAAAVIVKTSDLLHDQLFNTAIILFSFLTQKQHKIHKVQLQRMSIRCQYAKLVTLIIFIKNFTISIINFNIKTSKATTVKLHSHYLDTL